MCIKGKAKCSFVVVLHQVIQFERSNQHHKSVCKRMEVLNKAPPIHTQQTLTHLERSHPSWSQPPARPGLQSPSVFVPHEGAELQEEAVHLQTSDHLQNHSPQFTGLTTQTEQRSGSEPSFSRQAILKRPTLEDLL